MVKHWIYILSLFLIVSCGDSPKEIPEEKLKDLIADIVLTDSYITNIMKPNYRERDSIDYFTPILDKYGYTIEDLEYTFEKYSRRKTDVIWNTLDQATSQVDVIRDIYEKGTTMRKNWNTFIAERSVDTLYYHKDTINIRSADELKEISLIEALRNNGTITISYDYKTGKREKNKSRYLVYFFSDTLNKAVKPYRNSFWVAATNKNNDKRTMKRTIKVNNIRRHNTINILPFDYKNHISTRRKYKRMDTKIWNLLITFSPDPDDVDKKVLLEDNPYPFIIDAQSQYEDRFDHTLLIPYSFKTLGIKIDTIAIDSLDIKIDTIGTDSL